MEDAGADPDIRDPFDSRMEEAEEVEKGWQNLISAFAGCSAH